METNKKYKYLNITPLFENENHFLFIDERKQGTEKIKFNNVEILVFDNIFDIISTTSEKFDFDGTIKLYPNFNSETKFNFHSKFPNLKKIEVSDEKCFEVFKRKYKGKIDIQFVPLEVNNC